jgi:hypothetical protein
MRGRGACDAWLTAAASGWGEGMGGLGLEFG